MTRARKTVRRTRNRAPTPRPIVAFCCENSAARAAQSLAGHPLLATVEIVPVPCAGRVEIRHLLRPIENGARAVLVLACPLDNCVYLQGNRRALKRLDRARLTLQEAGIEPSRLRMDFLSSLDSHKLLNILMEVNQP